MGRCIIKCEDGYKMFALLEHLGLSYNEELYNIFAYNIEEIIWVMLGNGKVLYRNKKLFTGSFSLYLVDFAGSINNDWIVEKELPYHYFFREEKLERILRVGKYQQ